jgi:hypothetical protein
MFNTSSCVAVAVACARQQVLVVEVRVNGDVGVLPERGVELVGGPEPGRRPERIDQRVRVSRRHLRYWLRAVSTSFAPSARKS